MVLSKKGAPIFFLKIFLLAAILFLPKIASARVESCSTTRFADNSLTVPLNFPAGGGYNYDAKVLLPMGATISAAKVDLVPETLTGTPYIWVPLTATNQLVQIKTSDGSFVSRFIRGANTMDCTANCNTNTPTWANRSPAETCSGNAFGNPSRITTIPGGDVWVADRVGSYVTRLGKKTGCTGDNCYECKGSYLVGTNPKGVTFDSEGKIWVGDNGDNRIWKFNQDGTYAWAAPNYKDIGYPTYGMIADRKGNIWISTGSPTGVVRINNKNCDLTSCAVSVIVNSATAGTYNLEGGMSYGIGIDNNGDPWLGDWNGNSVDEINPTAIPLQGKQNCTTGFTGCCTGVAIDGKNNVWTSGYNSNLLYVIKNGNCSSVSSTLSNVCSISNPHGVAIDFNNNIWSVCTTGEVVKYSYDGSNITELKRINLNTGAGSGTAGNASYNYSDMTGFRSVPTSLNLNAQQFFPDSKNTYSGFNATLQASLVSCSCIDSSGVNQCVLLGTDCQVPLSLFSISGGNYTAKNLSIICKMTYPSTSAGLVPCGRLDVGDDPANIDMTKPCDVCAMFYMLKRIINYVMSLSVGIGVFILVIAGLLYAFSAGNPRNIDLAKTAVKNVVIGLTIVFTAWLLIAIILQATGYGSMTTWNQVDCILQN